MTTTAATAIQTLKAKAAEQSTPVLLGALYLLDAKGNLSNEERMTSAAIADTITERHGLSDLLDEIFMADEFTGTYTGAIETALAKVGA